jgi:hypothetical protein
MYKMPRNERHLMPSFSSIPLLLSPRAVSGTTTSPRQAQACIARQQHRIRVDNNDTSSILHGKDRALATLSIGILAVTQQHLAMPTGNERNTQTGHLTPSCVNIPDS